MTKQNKYQHFIPAFSLIPAPLMSFNRLKEVNKFLVDYYGNSLEGGEVMLCDPEAEDKELNEVFATMGCERSYSELRSWFIKGEGTQAKLPLFFVLKGAIFNEPDTFTEVTGSTVQDLMRLARGGVVVPCEKVTVHSVATEPMPMTFLPYLVPAHLRTYSRVTHLIEWFKSDPKYSRHLFKLTIASAEKYRRLDHSWYLNSVGSGEDQEGYPFLPEVFEIPTTCVEGLVYDADLQCMRVEKVEGAKPERKLSEAKQALICSVLDIQSDSEATILAIEAIVNL